MKYVTVICQKVVKVNQPTSVIIALKAKSSKLFVKLAKIVSTYFVFIQIIWKRNTSTSFSIFLKTLIHVSVPHGSELGTQHFTFSIQRIFNEPSEFEILRDAKPKAVRIPFLKCASIYVVLFEFD